MMYLFERMEMPLNEWRKGDCERAVRNQVQRLIEGHRLSGKQSGLDLIGMEVGNESPGSVIDLGAHAETEHTQFAKKIEKIIARYEPRLLRPTVTVSYAGGQDKPQMLVEGLIAHAGQQEIFRFSFEV